jgi:EpsI family protein
MMRRTCLLIVLLVAAAGARLVLGSPRTVDRAQPLSQFPTEIDGWIGTDSALDPEVVKTAAVNDYLNRYYESSGGTLGLYVGYYQSQRRGESLHSPLQCLPGAGWQTLENEPLEIGSKSDGTARSIRRLVVERGLDRLLVLYWYHTASRVTGNEYARKVFLMSDAFRSGRTDVALVRIVASFGRHDAADDTGAIAIARPFAERVLPEIQQRLFRE